MSDQPSEFLNLVEAARYLGVSRMTLYKLIREGKLTPFQSELNRAVRLVRRATGGRGAHAVIECAGTGQTLAQAVEMTRKGGHVAAIGTPLEPAALPVTKLVLDEIDLHGVRANRGTCEEVLPLMVRGAVDVRKLLTHRFPLSRFPEALDTFVKRKDGALKVLVEP